MNTIKTYFFLFFFSIFLVSSDVEEVIVQGDWRDTKLVEEDSSLLVLTSKEIDSASGPIHSHETLSLFTFFTKQIMKYRWNWN